MGILDDLAMGFGLKARTEDYDARTARNIAETQAFGDDHVSAMRARQGYVSTGPRGRDYAAEYRAALNAPNSQARNFLQRQGGEGYSPSIVPRDQDDRGFFQRALFSPESPESPRPYAIGPMKMDGPLQIPSVMGILNSVANAAFDRPLTGKPLSSGAVDALDGAKPFNKVASTAGILPVEDGQITEEELADVTETPENEFSGMDVNAIQEALMARFRETGEDPTLSYEGQYFNQEGDDKYLTYLNTKPMADKVLVLANRIAGRQ